MEKENPQGATLKKSLKERHMTMIALGGTIGTGLFVAGGETISTAGPGGALLSYALIGIMVYFLMTGLGEMSTWLPSSGSFGLYAARYVDKALGFALGWNYWFNWAITVAAELGGGGIDYEILVSRYSICCMDGWIFGHFISFKLSFNPVLWRK